MLEVSLLGSFEARIDGKWLANLHQRRANRLLSLLIIENNRRLQRQWIESVLDMSYDALRKAESVLRSCLGEERVRVRVVNNGLFLNLDGVQIDTVEFERLIESEDDNSLHRAILIYRGGLLKDWDGPWITTRREELKEHYLDALQKLTRSAIGRGDYDNAASLLRRFNDVYPQMDSVWAKLIEVYIQSGHFRDADQAYSDYLTVLKTRAAGEGRALKPSQRIVELISDARSGVGIPASPITPAHPAIQPPAPPDNPVHFEPVGGAVPIGSAYYIQRYTDELASTALTPQTSFILIKGPSQVGKTSLLARLFQQGRANGASILHTDWRNLPQSRLETSEAFLSSLAGTITDQLSLTASPQAHFDPYRPATRNFERFVLREVFTSVPGWIVWGIDEADRLFDCEYKDEVFGMLRSWHNERALNPGCQWERLTIVLCYATDGHLIKNIHQSPFNVGFPVEMVDFTPAQVSELNGRYGSPLKCDADINTLYTLVGGHPYLLRRCMLEMALHNRVVEHIQAQCHMERGLFRDHLERIRLALQRDGDLTRSVSEWLRNSILPTDDHLARLSAAGIVTGWFRAEMRIRCQLYEQMLRRVLL